jgi:hypothetical protein
MASTPKFNAKNLHYEKPEPAFLRRLRGEAASAGGGDSDRLNVQHARTGKKARLEMDDDDGPTIAYEYAGGGNVGREEYEALTKVAKAKSDDGDGATIEGEGKGGGEGGGKGREDHGSGSGAVDDGGEEREKQKVADVGGVKKRKAGKIVGGEDDGDVEQTQTKGGAVARSITTTTTTTTKSKSSKKQKKVKLSFDEPDS